MKQGEKLQYVGRLLRRAKGDADYEVVDDLTPYGIEISLQRLSLEEVSRFRIYKEEGGFYTDEIDTTEIKHTFYVAAAIVVENALVVATNRVSVTIENSSLGLSVAEQLSLSDYGEASPTSGTVDNGEWEYRIELARSGNSAEINSWSNKQEVSTFVFGTLFKSTPIIGIDSDGYWTVDYKNGDGAEQVLVDGEPMRATAINGVDGADGSDGADGADGSDGADGVTPVKGIDYYTQEEQEELIVVLSIPRVFNYDGSSSMLPNVEYHYVDGASTVSLSLSDESDGIANIYSLWFKTPSTSPTLVSSGVSFWSGDDVTDGVLNLVGSSLYEISISNGCAAVKNWGSYE